MKIPFLKKTLKLKIEFKRKAMYKKANNLGFTHPQVVNCGVQPTFRKFCTLSKIRHRNSQIPVR